MIKYVEASQAPLEIIRKSTWQEEWKAEESNLTHYNIIPAESLPPGSDLKWPQWRTLNRIRTGKAATPADKKMWGYLENDQCACGVAPCNLDHLLKDCQHYGEIPSTNDLMILNDKTKIWLDNVSDTI